jgi:hypothetical protein
VENSEGTAQFFDGIGRLRLGAVLALSAAAVFVGWLLIKQGDDDSAPPKTVESASVSDLRALPESVGHPVYWAGTKPGYTYELTKTREGNVYIRYLPPGVAPGDNRPDFLTVGSYPYPDALTTARTQSRRPGAFRRTIAGGGVAYSLRGNLKSVYFAYPRLDYLYEVFDPVPRRARRLVLGGRVRPIG